MRGWQLLFWTATIFAHMAGVSAAERPVQRPEELLSARFGLHRLPASSVWVTGQEVELRALWATLPQHRVAVLTLEQVLAERIDRNARDWAVADRTETTLRASLAGLTQSDGQRPQFERQLTLLRRGITPPERLGDAEEVRAQLVQLNDHRHALFVGVRAIRQKTVTLDEGYAGLRRDPELTAQLRKAGPKHRLGPAKDYRKELEKLAELERPTLTAWTPLYLVGDHQRLSLLANDLTPLTFSWTSSPEPTLITAAMAEAIGLKPRVDTKEQQIRIGKQSCLAAPAVIPYLRLGKFEVREVEVLILPPEAESAGARIGPLAFPGFRVETQPARLRVTIEPATAVTP